MGDASLVPATNVCTVLSHFIMGAFFFGAAVIENLKYIQSNICILSGHSSSKYSKQ
jgi:hypothetical protein